MNKDRIDEAIRFAARKHNGQMRKTEPYVPYIAHVVAVGFILISAGYDDEVVIAGILHDTIEDTDTTFNEISSIFGDEVSDIVSTVSEDKSLPWEERKSMYLKKVLASSDDAKAVAIADKLHNVDNLLRHIRAGNDGVWDVFTRNRQSVIDNYRIFVDSISQKIESSLLDELIIKVTLLEKLTNIT